jgi:uncharacterized membrane protein
MKTPHSAHIHGLSPCHCRPDRSFFYKGVQFPVCARCTGIFIGFLILPYFLISQSNWGLLLSVLLILPTYLDGWIQTIWEIESTNMRRVTTGFVAGLGMMSLASWLGQNIGTIVLNFINN